MKLSKHPVWLLAFLFSAAGCYKNEPLPQAGFTFTADSGFRAPCTVMFINQSVNAFSYEWKFGDDSVSTDTNPVHTYMKEGNFYVELKAFTESREEWDDLVRKLTVQPAP